MDTLQTEAILFCKYLVGQKPSADIIERYQHFIAVNKQVATPRDNQVLAFAIKHPRAIPLLDNALAFIQPSSELRRRIYTMFTILEASPQYAPQFLPIKRSPLYILGLIWSGSTAVVQMCGGIILLKVIIR